MGSIGHNQNTRDAAAAVLHMIRDQQGCAHFGKADTLPEFIDVILFG